jgi:ribonuclease J
MLLIEVNGCRILYSGDFRIHGRKSVLVSRMMASPPASIDALIMEGTNLGSDKPCCGEEELEGRFIDLFKASAGRVFVTWSAQNVDRTVKRTDRAYVHTCRDVDEFRSYAEEITPEEAAIQVANVPVLLLAYVRSGSAAGQWAGFENGNPDFLITGICLQSDCVPEDFEYDVHGAPDGRYGGVEEGDDR